MTRKVEIPAGVDTGTQVRLSGEGEPSPGGGPPGDCYCVIHVKEHELFHRDGRRLICQVPISYAQAALGTVVQVPTLDGCEEVTIPAGTQPGDVLTLRGRGMPDPRYHGRGDLLVQLAVEVPKKLTPRHEEVLRELAEIENAHVSPKRKSFVNKLQGVLSPGTVARGLSRFSRREGYRCSMRRCRRENGSVPLEMP